MAGEAVDVVVEGGEGEASRTVAKMAMEDEDEEGGGCNDVGSTRRLHHCCSRRFTWDLVTKPRNMTVASLTAPARVIHRCI